MITKETDIMPSKLLLMELRRICTLRTATSHLVQLLLSQSMAEVSFQILLTLTPTTTSNLTYLGALLLTMSIFQLVIADVLLLSISLEHLVKTQTVNSGTQTASGTVMQIKSVETIVLSLISWKQINGLGKQQLMNVMLPTVMDSTVHATVVAPATRIMSINSHTQIMVLVATSRSIPLKLSMFSLTSTSLTINSVHL